MKRKITWGLLVFLGLLILELSGFITKAALIQADTKDFEIKDHVLLDYLGSDTIVTVPKGVTEIGENAFSESSQVKEIIIPDSVTRIGWGAFKDCTLLESVTLPMQLTYLCNNLFQGCSGLKNIQLPASLKSIGDCAFQDCSSLESIKVPEGVVILGWYAFRGCSKLSIIHLPDSLENVGYWTFKGTKWLSDYEEDALIINSMLVSYQGTESKYVIPDFITNIEDGAFEANTSLEEVVFPEGVLAIGNSTFTGCANLKKINIPEGVTTIGSFAFSGCSLLSDITIPSSVIEFGENIIKGTKYYENYQSDFFIINNILLEYLGDEEVVRIPDKVTIINSKAFADKPNIIKIILPDSVRWMKAVSIYNCTGLLYIGIPKSVSIIDEEAILNVNDELEICGIFGSVAEEYAKAGSIPFTGITFHQSNVTVYLGKTSNTVRLEIGNMDLEIAEKVSWVSSNETIAQVSSDGLVTAKEAGVSFISTDINGLAITCKVTVKAPQISSKAISLLPGKYFTLKVHGFSEGIVWKSTDIKRAKVNANGKVTAVKKGKVTITAKVDGATYTCTVNVIEGKK